MKVKQSRIVRTRPIFRHGVPEFRLEYEDTLLDLPQVVEFASRAALRSASVTGGPECGRFRVEVEES